MTTPTRRTFLQSSLAATAVSTAAAADKPNEKISLAVVGVKNRGKDLLKGFASFPNVEIAYVCDADLNLVADALKLLPATHKRTPKVVQDMRTVFQDKSVDAVAIATPDHWHALATIRACQAEKHVYVEKPVSHNIFEGRQMVKAARKYKRVVQVGTQRRSADNLRRAADFVRSGKLGKIPFARTWIAGNRKSIGRRSDSKTPDKVDYNLWLGPAPSRPFNQNRFHYNWHWFWDYGTGEIGNNGIHGLDVVRMLLDLTSPKRISAGGGKYFYDDDQQTPDTMQVSFDFANCTVVWEHRIWAATGVRNQSFGIELVGEKGTLVVDDQGWYVDAGPQPQKKGGKKTDKEPDKKAEKVIDKPGPFMQAHYKNFLDCIKSGDRPNADIEIGHHSTRLCHLGNIAYRLGRTLRFDGTTDIIPGDAEAGRLLGREYRKGFEVPTQV